MMSQNPLEFFKENVHLSLQHKTEGNITNKINKMPQRIPDQRETGSGGVNLENSIS
jgi:hypothetical protein